MNKILLRNIAVVLVKIWAKFNAKVFFSFPATGNKWYRCGYADYCGHDSDCCLPGLNCKNNFCDHN